MKKARALMRRNITGFASDSHAGNKRSLIFVIDCLRLSFMSPLEGKVGLMASVKKNKGRRGQSLEPGETEVVPLTKNKKSIYVRGDMCNAPHDT